MIPRKLGFIVSVVGLTLSAACTVPNPLAGGATGSGKATILGRLVSSSKSARLLSAIPGQCPEVHVSINGAPASIEFDNDCSFVIKDVPVSDLVTVRVELVALGVAGTVELTKVLDGEVIEILVEATDNSLTVSVERRSTPSPSDVLPEVITGNNVSIHLPAGVFKQNLTVSGNNFTLTGEAGQNCNDQAGWTVIDGKVLVNGNNATFQNIMFAGPVELHGNNAHFINCCFGDKLIVFGNNANVGGDDHADGDDDQNGDDDQDGDKGGKKHSG